jgi:hypothetical protein
MSVNPMYHTSNPVNRENILKNGLLPSVGERRCFGNELLPPAVFLSLMEPFDTTFDDDVYWVEWDYSNMTIDTAMSDSYYQFEPIPPIYIKLIKEGTGKDLINS